MKTKDANVQTDLVHILPRLLETKDANVQTDPVQVVPSSGETSLLSSNMLRSSNTGGKRSFCSSRSRRVRRCQKKRDDDDCTWQVRSKPSADSIPTLKISRHCRKHHVNGVASSQPLTKLRQNSPPDWSPEPPTLKSSSAACRSSHSSARKRSRSSHFDCSKTRPVSQSRKRQSNMPLMDRRSRLKTGSSRHGKKSTSSSLYKRSMQKSQSPTKECSGSFNCGHVGAINHSSSHRSAKSTSKKRSLQHSESGISTSRLKCRRLERSTRNWQLSCNQNRAVCSSLVRPVMSPLCPYLPPLFNFATPILFPHLFPFSAPPLFCPPFVIPIPLWNLWQHL